MIRGNILTIGFSTIELRITTPYSVGGDKRCLESDKYKFSAGGIGATTAIGISRLGWGSMFCTALGDDMFGSTYGRILTDERVDQRYVKKCRNAQTAIDFAFDNKSGGISVPASSRQINSNDVENAFGVMPDAVITTLELPCDVVETASRCASFQNSKFILDATGAKSPADVEAIKHVDIIILGDKELSALTGMEVRTIDDRRKCCISLNSAMKVDYTVIDMGENGCYVYDGKYFEFVMPYDTLPVVDERGSREAFLSAIAVALLRAENIGQAVDFASASKAIALSREGGFESLPTEKEVRDLQKGSAM